MPMISQPQLTPDAEAHKIYTAIFGRAIPRTVQERFVAASERLERTVAPQELAAYGKIVAVCDDLEALEVAARYSRRLPLLGRKFRLMVYLAETLPENQPFFVNARGGFLVGLWQSAIGVLATIFKLLKGFWLLRRVAHA